MFSKINFAFIFEFCEQNFLLIFTTGSRVNRLLQKNSIIVLFLYFAGRSSDFFAWSFQIFSVLHARYTINELQMSGRQIENSGIFIRCNAKNTWLHVVKQFKDLIPRLFKSSRVQSEASCFV